MDHEPTRSLVVGVGSIGLRHLRVLSGLGHRTAAVTRRPDLESGVEVFDSVAAAIAAFDPQYVIVATETARHAGTVSDLRAAGFSGLLMVEKPLAVDPADLGGFRRVGVGFNLRFHPALAHLRALVAARTVYTVEAYAGQALSTWRPGREVGKTYSASRALGGGVLRDLSHELDYLGWVFGPCTGVFARGGRIADVTEDSDDAWGIVAEHASAPVVTLQFNYLDTLPRRRVVVTSAQGSIEADLRGGWVRTDDGVREFDVEADDSYRAMHMAMVGDGAGVATVGDAASVDALIELIESSARQRAWLVPA